MRERKFTNEYPKFKVAGTEEDGFGGSGILITMLPTGKVVRDVLLGENGIARNLKAGMYLRLLAGYVTESRFRFSCN
jgi:3-hydroxyisobutyrate dehydrogenase-like beta-hydroxyacid dehydrogenase